MENFIIVYPEFKQLVENEGYRSAFYNLIAKIKCTTYRYNCISDYHLHECKMYQFFALTAHYVVVSNLLPSQTGALPGDGGIVSSASLGNASVSYDTSIDSKMIGSSAYKRFLYTTPYGKEYVAMLERNTGLLTIN